jgi:hypothetical protein
MPKKKPQGGKPEMHPDLDGFELSINEFGEIKTNMDLNKVNEFLNRNVDDKKFKERDDLNEIKKGKFVPKDNTKKKDKK